MSKFLSNQYRSLFGRPFFFKWNRALLKLSLTGLGINNHGTSKDRVTGEWAFLKRDISKKKSPILFDVGANIGEWSEMALTINPSSQIYAFEPSSRSFEKLKTVSHIKAFNVACGEREETATLYDLKAESSTVLASLDYDVLKRIEKNPIREEVKVISLDSIIQKENIVSIDLLKIDVEGFEYEVLLGAQKAIADGKIRKIQFEFNEMNVARRRFFRDFYDLLPDFDFYRLLPSGQIPLGSYKYLLHELFGFQNIIAIKRPTHNEISEGPR